MRFCLILITCICFLLPSTSSYAADPNAPVFTCAAAAGYDYKLQGEYLRDSNGDEVAGVQVIAHGDGEFSATAFVGGLPGAGWSRGDAIHRAKGQYEGNKLVLHGDGGGGGEILGDTLRVFNGDGEEITTLKKHVRKSPTLGAKPPEDAVVLFDGTNLDRWENAKLIDGKYLGATNAYTKLKLKDHKLHLEFRTPFMPKSSGQGRGNSGVYVQGRYEVQVLDSFGLDGKDNECGGIYSINRPKVNAGLPPLTWQTYDMDFTAAKYDGDKKVKNARITVRHNGIVIHDDQELAHDTPGRHKEGPDGDALFLQDHGNPVVYRNIWVVEK